MGKKVVNFQVYQKEFNQKELPNFQKDDLTINMVFPSFIKKAFHVKLLLSITFLFILLLCSNVSAKVLIKFQRREKLFIFSKWNYNISDPDLSSM